MKDKKEIKEAKHRSDVKRRTAASILALRFTDNELQKERELCPLS